MVLEKLLATAIVISDARTEPCKRNNTKIKMGVVCFGWVI
jgi:hypothetical protein